MLKWLLLKLYYRDNCGDFSPMFSSPSLSSSSTNNNNNRYTNPSDCVATNELSESHHNMMNNVLSATVQNCVIMHVARLLSASCFSSRNPLVMIIYFVFAFFLTGCWWSKERDSPGGYGKARESDKRQKPTTTARGSMWWKPQSAPAIFKGHCLRSAGVESGQHSPAPRTYVSSSWIIENLKFRLDACAIEERERGRIIDDYGTRTITASKQTFSRIFKSTIINVDMFGSPGLFASSIMCDVCQFASGPAFTFSKTINNQINLELCMREADGIGFEPRIARISRKAVIFILRDSAFGFAGQEEDKQKTLVGQRGSFSPLFCCFCSTFEANNNASICHDHSSSCCCYERSTCLQGRGRLEAKRVSDVNSPR